MGAENSVKVLLIESDERLGELTARYLRSHGIEVDIERHQPAGPRGGYACVVLGPLVTFHNRAELDRALRVPDVPCVSFAARESDREIGVAEDTTGACSLKELLRRIRVAIGAPAMDRC